MLSVQIRSKLFYVIEVFKNDFCNAFGELRFVISAHRHDFNKDEIDALIDIYKHAIQKANAPSENVWVGKNSRYFRDNSGANKVWQKKFDTGNFTYEEFPDFIEQIKDIKEYEFMLRNPEVTLRSDVGFEKDTIKILCNTYVSVLEDIIHGKYR